MDKDVSFKTGLWSEVKQDLEDRKIQVLPLVGRTPEREAIFDFTFPYLVMHGTIVVRDDTTDIRIPADLKGKRVAVLHGDNAEEYLIRANLGAEIIGLDSFGAALTELSKGSYDAVVIQKLLAMQIIQSSSLKNLKTVGPPLEEFKQSFCFATAKGDTELLALLNEGLSIVIAGGTFRELYATWFSPIEASVQSSSRLIVGGDDSYPPYEFIDKNGQPAGFNVDLTKAIARQLGMDVEIHLGPWNEIRKGLSTGAIDVAQGMFYSVERDRIYGFSPAHSIINHVIASRKDTPSLDYVKELEGKSVIVMAGDVMEDLARSLGLEKNLVSVSSQEQALLLLSSGKHDYALVAQVPALYFIKQNRLTNIQLSQKPILAAEYCYAAPHSNGSVISQLSQGLAAIQATGEYRAIEEKWLSPYRAEHTGLLAIARIAGGIILVLSGFLLFVILWSWSLKQKVMQKTKQLSIEIAERSKAEEEVRELNKNLENHVVERTAQLEAAIKELEAFSYAVSHDLRAPLRAMEGFSSILLESYGVSLDDSGRNYLARIRDASIRMGQLIEDLLGLSRVTRYPLVRKKVDLSKLASETFTRVLESWEGKAPVISIEPGMTVLADPSLTEILLRNLLENAVKYSSKAESPKIEIGSMESDGSKSVAKIFWVRDNGVGFDMNFAGRLFEPFNRLHADKEYDGTGIGLVTVKRIVTRHGGRVWPEANPGEGACFYFTFE
jgi:ABC-type amino acid transport substrate-binding protein/nitrogen-specific signal transduction histidine kinase